MVKFSGVCSLGNSYTLNPDDAFFLCGQRTENSRAPFIVPHAIHFDQFIRHFSSLPHILSPLLQYLSLFASISCWFRGAHSKTKTNNLSSVLKKMHLTLFNLQNCEIFPENHPEFRELWTFAQPQRYFEWILEAKKHQLIGAKRSIEENLQMAHFVYRNFSHHSDAQMLRNFCCICHSFLTSTSKGDFTLKLHQHWTTFSRFYPQKYTKFFTKQNYFVFFRFFFFFNSMFFSSHRFSRISNVHHHERWVSFIDFIDLKEIHKKPK